MSVTILCYHKVGSASEEGRRLNIEPLRLRSHVQFFVRKNRKFILAGDLPGSMNSGVVCFTFDDAYFSTMVHAPSVFEEAGTRATFYAVPGRVGKSSDWDGELARPLADWDLLLSAQSKGHEIGNHSQNHLHLADLDAQEQLAEIRTAHEALENKGLHPPQLLLPLR